MIDYCRIFQPSFKKKELFNTLRVSAVDKEGTPGSKAPTSARNADKRSQRIVTEDGVRNVRRKFVAESQAKLYQDGALAAAGKRAPGGILKTKTSSPAGAPMTQAAGHVSLNVADSRSLRHSEKREDRNSQLFSPILSLRNNFTGDLPASGRHSITMFDGQGLRVKKMNETYNSIDLKDKLTKYRLNSSQNNKFRIRQKRIRCGQSPDTENNNSGVFTSMTAVTHNNGNVNISSHISPGLSSSFDRSNAELNQKFYDNEVEKILDDKLRHVTVTRDIIKQNNPGYKIPQQ